MLGESVALMSIKKRSCPLVVLAYFLKAECVALWSTQCTANALEKKRTSACPNSISSFTLDVVPSLRLVVDCVDKEVTSTFLTTRSVEQGLLEVTVAGYDT